MRRQMKKWNKMLPPPNKQNRDKFKTLVIRMLNKLSGNLNSIKNGPFKMKNILTEKIILMESTIE